MAVATTWARCRRQSAAAVRWFFDHRAQDDRENANCDHDYRLGINHPRIEEKLAFVVLRKLRPADAQPIQLDRHDFTTTGPDPAQYLGPVGTPESQPIENVSNEPKPGPSIILPHICPNQTNPRTTTQRTTRHQSTAAPTQMMQTKGDGRGFRPPQEMKIRPFNAIAVSTSYAYFRKNPSPHPLIGLMNSIHRPAPHLRVILKRTRRCPC